MKIAQPSLLIIGIALFLSGCSGVGNAPAGDDNAVKDAMGKMSREEKIKFINSSPLNAEQKKAKLKEMGIEDAPEAPSTPGAPAGR